MKNLTNFPLPRVKLAGTYLLIIMTMSIVFSIILYQISNQELVRQRQLPIPRAVPRDLVNEFDTLRELRLLEARSAVRQQLILFNLATLSIGAILSYLLARKALQPIERAMTAQQRFASDASHEIRTPLTAMRSEIEVTLRDKALTLKDAKATLKSNLEEIDTLENLTDSLLRLAASENLEVNKQSVNITKLTKTVEKQLDPLLKTKNIQLKVNVPKKCSVQADSDGLRQAVVILLDNAIKYSPNNDTIELTLKNQATQTKISIIDHGKGIPAEDLPHIFDRFYQADNARSDSSRTGYGLGLSIAKNIIEAQGGNIAISSKVNKGTTATITLPK